MRKSNISKLLSFIMTITVVFMTFTGCNNKEQSKDKKDVTLTMLFHDDFQYEYFADTHNISEAYKKVNPNVTIEIEKVKDTGELENALKIRNTADELPDIMLLKPYMLSGFKSVLEPLNDTKATKNNLFAEEYAVDGDVVGIPESAFYEFVYYRKSIFQKYGLEIPKTWDEFVDTAVTIKEKEEFVPILLGGKDAWPDYPFNEFMPCLQAGDGQQWNVMANDDTPFDKDKAFYKAYKKIDKLYKAEVFGNDPLGIGFDQAKSMFVAKKGAMIAAGQWFLTDYANMDGDMDDLGLFLLPVRDSEKDTFYATVMADGFYATPKNGENKEASIEFMEWYFNSDYYKEYLNAKGINSTIKGVKVDRPIINKPFDDVDPTLIVYDGGNENFKKIVDSFGFDVKKLGQEMLSGKDLDEMMNELNNNWSKGRELLK